ncbi:MAG: GNAT family N-acetyltransferase [Anaerolineales bacterium]|uniref:GNAT family N-acetyltransferase n=1 Tax=Candidatus Villigracilis saccharophilus TaxID=3140684 RepID=UPI0031373D9E|nr:GNAT family N-acetyltransferase [Anaerolineales bacterium]MBK8420088.1 GNAT family N-acetyltransferase [Anaerolineales bacterium]
MINYILRPALETEAAQIKKLINLVGINPTGLDWKRFIVAVNDDRRVIGCGQIKPHGADIRELASIAVDPAYQGNGIARAVMDQLLSTIPRPVYLMCVSTMEGLYIKFGFKAIPYEAMPRYFQRISNVFRIADVIRHSGEELLVMKME